MRIAVFGASGMAGAAIVAESLAREHEVHAASRRPSAVHPEPDRLTISAVDVSEPDTLDPILAEAGAAVLSVRPAPGDEGRLAPLTRSFLDAASRHSTRVLVIGGSAPLHSPNHPGLRLIDDPLHVPSAWKSIAQASLDQFHACQEHS